MKKRKVIGFFIVLLLFAAALAFIQSYQYSGLTGYLTLGNEQANSDKSSSRSSELAGFAFLLIAFMLIGAYIVKYLHGHYESVQGTGFESNKKELIHINMEN